ncbi:TPA: hypothetical protein ACIPUI_002508 [Citrobacter freundii]
MTGRINFVVGVAAFLTLTSIQAVCAQERAAPPPSPGEMIIYNLAQAGLMYEFNSYEDYGTVQARIGQARAEIEAARATGIDSGYKDSANVGVLPVDLFYSLPGTGSNSFIKVGGFGNWNYRDKNQTQVYSRAGRIELEFLNAPTPDTLLGIGFFTEKQVVDFIHNDGYTEDLGYGVRGDFVQKINQYWGIAARAEYFWADGKTRVPLGGGLKYGYDQDWQRVYSQLSLVGSFDQRALNFLPQTWVFHPTLRAAYQGNHYKDVRDNFGQTVNGTVGPNDAYSMITATARFEDVDLRPGNIAPMFEIGVNQEIKNDLNVIVDDPTSIHTSLGASANLGGGAMINVAYTRNDGLKGERRDQALTLHIGLLY